MNDSEKEVKFYKDILTLIDNVIKNNGSVEKITASLLTAASGITLACFDNDVKAEFEYIQLSKKIWECSKEYKNNMEKESIIDKVEEILKES